MINVKIKNFQSIGDLSFDIDGFTVIVGKNNIGKSAIIRAIDAALNNRIGGEFIRFGKIKSEVNFKRDSLDINWTKGEKAVYKVNGQTYSGLNRSVPQPVLKAGFQKIETDDKKLDVLVAHQFNELFLLNETGTFITEVLSTLYDLNTLNDADDLCQKQLRSNKTLLKTREADLETLQDKIATFKDFGTVKSDWEKIKTLNSKVESLTSEISVLDDSLKNINKLSSSVINLKRIEKISVPDIQKSAKISEECSWVETICGTLQSALRSVKALNPITTVLIPNAEAVSVFFQEMSGLEILYQHLKGAVQTLEKFKDFKIYTETFQNINEKASALNTEINNFSYLVGIHKTLSDQAVVVRSLKTEHAENQTQLEKIDAEYKQFKICPACGKAL